MAGGSEEADAHDTHEESQSSQRTVTVPLPIPAHAVILRWSGSAEAHLEVRSRRDGAWSPWVEVGVEPDEGPDEGTEPGDPGRVTAGPVWVGAGTDAVELRPVSGEILDLTVEVLRSLDESTNPPARSTGTTARVKSGETAAEAAVPSSGAPAEVAAGVPAPAIVTRAAWGAGPWRDENPDCAGGPFDADSLRFGIVHHTVSTNSYQPWEADDLVRAIYVAHTDGNRWCDIAYNFLVDRYGTVFEGRTGSMTRPITGAHAKGFNSGSVGVALLGQYHPSASPPAAEVTTEQLGALADVLAWKFDLWDIDPFGVTTEVSGGSTRWPEGVDVVLPTVTSHRAVSATSCPGDNAERWLGELRKMIARRIRAHDTGPYPDVPADHPFAREIGAMKQLGVLDVPSAGDFEPSRSTTRGVMARWLWRFAGRQPATGDPYPDTSGDTATAALWLGQKRIASPFGDGLFRGGLAISRGSALVWLWRFAGSPPQSGPAPFSDVPTTDRELVSASIWAYKAGIARGGADGRLRPTAELARQEAAVLLYRMLAYSMFADIGRTSPFFTEIGWVAARGLMVGDPDGRFLPAAAATRGQLAVVLYRMAGSPPGPFPTPRFSDVPDYHPWRNAIGWAASSGLMRGYPDGTFKPAHSLTRSAAAVVLHRLASSPPASSPPPFSDVPASAAGSASVAWAAEVGLMLGWPDGTFRPQQAVDRQGLAALLRRQGFLSGWG